MLINVGMAKARLANNNSRDSISVPSSVTVTVLDGMGAPIAPFTAANCVPITKDSVRQPVSWKGAADLVALAGKQVKLRFELSGRAQLYSFWVSKSTCGESNGYVAAGGKGFTGMTDTAGSCAP